MELAELKAFVQQKEQEGKVVLMTCEGLTTCDIDKFCQQSAAGILYDLNRDRVTALTQASEDNYRWVNDYAVAVVITKLIKDLRDADWYTDWILRD